MGTLHSQPERNQKNYDLPDVEALISYIKVVALQEQITFDQALRAFELKELQRRNNLFIANGDAWDEQISGIGSALDGIASAIESLNSTEL